MLEALSLASMALLALVQAPAAAAPTRQATATATRYTFTYSADSMRLVRVTAEFTLKDSTLAMVPYGAEHLPDGWRTFVHNERMTSGGRPVALTRLPERRWKVAGPLGRPVRLTYDVAIDHDRKPWIPDAREAAYVRDWGVFTVGRAVFIYNDENARDIEIAFRLPEGWKVGTAWQPRGANAFTAPGWGDAINSVVFAGRFRSFDVRQESVTVSYAIGGGERWDASEPLLRGVTTDMIDSYRRLFHGAPAARLFVVINPDRAGNGGGGVFRQSISMTFPEPPSAAGILAWGHTLSHELFHVWNAHTMRRDGPSEEWFVEGFAEYYSNLTMARRGHYAVGGLLAKMSRALRTYERAAGQISLRQAGHQEWEQPGPDMLYNGGWMAALTLDMMIRQHSGGARSLDDAMTDLYQRLSGGTPRLTNAELLAAVSRALGDDATPFFDRYVFGTERLPVAQAAAYVGLSAEGGEFTLVANPSPAQSAAWAAYLPGIARDGTVLPGAALPPVGH